MRAAAQLGWGSQAACHASWPYTLKPLRPLNLSDAGCGSGVTYNHINVEQWSEDYAKEWSEIQAKYPSRAPLDLGSMGYATFRMETFWNTTEDGMPHGAAMRSTLTPWIRLTEARCIPAMIHALCPRSRTRITSGSQAQGPKDATKTSTTTDTVWSLDPSLKSTFVGPSSDLDAVSR